MISLWTPARKDQLHTQPAHSVLQAPPFGRSRPYVGAMLQSDYLSSRVRLSEAETLRVASLLGAIRKAQVGGEFWARGGAFRERSVILRPRTANGARRMVQDALSQVEASSILVSTPDRVWSRGLRVTLRRTGVAVRLGPVDPWALLESARQVHVEEEDPIAFLGLAIGASVHCTKDCALSGWGLTEDSPTVLLRGHRTLEQAAHAVLVSEATYRDPFTGQLTTCEEIVDILADWRRTLSRNREIGACVGMSMWKRTAVAHLLHTGDAAPPFRRLAGPAVAIAARREAAVAVWASRTPKTLVAKAAQAHVPVMWVEDGFLRSQGLGSNLTPPCSIVVDGRGPHYAPDRPSDLEVLLTETAFDPVLLNRAERLIADLVRLGVTKYGSPSSHAPLALPEGRRLVLVAGQVDDDRSVQAGGCGISGALDLLERVRALEPDAAILFKPHPDVEAGHRRGAVSDADALKYADRIVRDLAMPDLLSAVDVVHVLTSQAGFEALLRKVEVVVHGQPFYAGWGLTRDLNPPPRRGRALSVAELVAGALILYPRYIDPATFLPCSPEVLVARLVDAAPRISPLTRARQVQGWLRKRARPMRGDSLCEAWA